MRTGLICGAIVLGGGATAVLLLRVLRSKNRTTSSMVLNPPSTPPSDQPQQLRPLSVNYFIARECNYACRFCFHTDLKEGHVESLENVKKAMLQLKEAGMQKMNVSGGEPFLKPKLLGEICKYCKEDLGVFVGIVSNGSKITEQWMQSYSKYVDMIAVSCDSADNDTNIFIGRDDRGNHLQIVREAAMLIKKYGIQFKMNTTVTRASMDEDMNALIDELQPVRWKVFQVLPIEGENVDGVNGRDASDLWITDDQYAAFLERHKKQPALVVENNDTMRSSYLLLDEQLRFLDCRTNRKIPSRSILEVGVQTALLESGFYDVEAFHRRDGAFFASSETCSMEIEDCGVERKVDTTKGEKKLIGKTNVVPLTYRSWRETIEVLTDLEDSKPVWWTPACTAFCAAVRTANPANNKASTNRQRVIVVEGLDGVGKTTASKLLAERVGAVWCSTPDPTYEDVRSLFRILPPTLSKAFYAGANYLMAARVSQLAETSQVVIDRWWFSTCAYSVKPAGPLPVSADLAWPADLKPAFDVGFLLTLPEQERAKRVASRNSGQHGEEVALAASPAKRERTVQVYRSFQEPSQLKEISSSGSPSEVVESMMQFL